MVPSYVTTTETEVIEEWTASKSGNLQEMMHIPHPLKSIQSISLKIFNENHTFFHSFVLRHWGHDTIFEMECLFCYRFDIFIPFYYDICRGRPIRRTCQGCQESKRWTHWCAGKMATCHAKSNIFLRMWCKATARIDAGTLLLLTCWSLRWIISPQFFFESTSDGGPTIDCERWTHRVKIFQVFGSGNAALEVTSNGLRKNKLGADDIRNRCSGIVILQLSTCNPTTFDRHSAARL